MDRHAAVPPLPRETQLELELTAIIVSDEFDVDPTALLAELRRCAGQHSDVLARAAGRWIRDFAGPKNTAAAEALRTLPGVEEWLRAAGAAPGSSERDPRSS